MDAILRDEFESSRTTGDVDALPGLVKRRGVSQRPETLVDGGWLALTQPQSQMSCTAVAQFLNFSRWAVNCWLPPSVHVNAG
jgi:hypothetical protein